MIESSGTPGICNIVASTCNGCVCVPDGQGTGTCTVVSKQGLAWIDKAERTCQTTTIEFARCPTSGNSFDVTCSGSGTALGSFNCQIPTQGRGTLDGLTCSMDISWFGNFGVEYVNPTLVDVVGPVSYSHVHTIKIGGAAATDITSYFSYVNTGSSGSWVGPVFSDPAFTVVALGFEGLVRFTGTASNRRESNYLSNSAFRSALNAASGNGATNVVMQVTYSATGDSGPFDFRLILTNWADTRTLSCQYN